MSRATDLAYERIRQKIITGDYAAGIHLKEEQIAGDTGVSRTPVREALRRLNAEHLVKFVPNRGAYVASWSAEDVEEIFTLRALLEGHAAFRAATRITEAAIGELERCVEEIERMLPGQSEGQRFAIVAANQRFHSLVCEAAATERLTRMLAWLVEIPIILKTFERYSVQDIERSNLHHREMIEAFKARDARWAQSVMDTHLRVALRVYAAQPAN